MLGQTIPEKFASEALLVSYFLILVLSLELAIFFIIQKATRRERSPAWILTFSVTMFAFSGVYLMRALNDLAFGSTPAITDSLYQVDFLIISASGIVTGYLMLVFFKNSKKLIRTLSVVVLLLGIASLVLNLITMLVTWAYAILAVALASSVLLPVASFPIYLLLQLAKRDEAGYKKVFVIIGLGVMLNFIGLAFNFQRVQSILIDSLGSAYPAFKISVLIVIAAGMAMITFGFYYIPPIDDFLWVNQLVALYVLDKVKRRALFKQIYDQKVVDGFSFGDKQAAAGGASEGAFVSGIGGITEMLSETSAADGKKVDLIDQGPVKILFSYQGNLIFILLVKQTNPVLSSMLRNFKDDFLLFFGDMITRFADNPGKFLPAETVATRIFGVSRDVKR